MVINNMTIKEAMEEILRIKECSMTNKEAIQILKDEKKSNLEKTYSHQVGQADYAYKMAIVSLAMTMTQKEKDTPENVIRGRRDNADHWCCPTCGNTLAISWEHPKLPDRCNICGQKLEDDADECIDRLTDPVDILETMSFSFDNERDRISKCNAIESGVKAMKQISVIQEILNSDAYVQETQAQMIREVLESEG